MKMEYSVGSLADLISGSNTPNKPKVVKTEFKMKTKKSKNIKETQEDFGEVLQPEKKLKTKKKHNKPEEKFEEPIKKVKKRKNANSIESAPEQMHLKKQKFVLPEDTVGSIDVLNEKKTKKLKKKLNENNSENGFDKKDINIDVLNKRKTKKLKKKVNENNSESSFHEKDIIRERENQEILKMEERNSLIIKEHTKRTLFIGNLPLDVNKKKLKKMFEKFGIVESVRLRSAPIADERVPKKVAVIKKQFHKSRTSINGYVRFADRDGAVAATQLNGTEYCEHHIRVKLCDDSEKPDQNKAIFLGNVSFEAEDEELWKLFESCGAIESVRLVRDRKTDVGKGFGYINFISADSVELALQLENVVLRGRELRISACQNKKNKKVRQEINKTGDESNSRNEQTKAFRSSKDFQGKKISERKKKRFDKGNIQKKKLIKKIAPKTIS